jgi:hypothetical protein
MVPVRLAVYSQWVYSQWVYSQWVYSQWVYSQCAGRQIQRPSRGAHTQRPST